LQQLQWGIVEQPRLAAIGRRDFETSELHFHDSVESCLTSFRPNVVLLSAVLQYLPQPYEVLGKLLDQAFDFIVLDRHASSMTTELITVQRLPKSLNGASYPSWLLDCRRMWSLIEQRYERHLEWEGKDPPIRGRGIGAHFIGASWRRRES
jgi:putative methyltransferase (TIGR04325 family)